MTNRWIVTALGEDRPGIVAGVTKVLYERGCNLEDSAMRRLEGEFAIMLIFSVSAKATEETLRKAFLPLEREMRLVVHLKRLTKSEAKTPRKGGQLHLISIYGADRRGIVYRIAEAMARAKINIADVHTHRSEVKGKNRGSSLFMLLLEVELPQERSADSLERQLKRIAKRLRVEMTLRPSEPNIL